MKIGRRRKSEEEAKISVLNLIDVIFMLLIFFMIATTFNKYSQFQLSLPKINSKEKSNIENKIEVIIDKNENYFLNKNGNVQKISLEDMKNILKNFNETELENMTLTADENLQYGKIIYVMNELKNEGVKNINLNLQKNNK